MEQQAQDRWGPSKVEDNLELSSSSKGENSGLEGVLQRIGNSS
jgi:hypothetical protein